MDDKRAKNVVAMLRAVLQSSKEGVLASRVQGEYRGITGEFLPYKQLGFQSLDAYMQSIPDVARIARNRDGEVVYHAVADASTLHIQRLKAGEKSNKRRKPSKGFKYKVQRRPVQTHQRFNRKPASPYVPRFHPSPKSFGTRPNYLIRPQPILSAVTSYFSRPQPITSAVPPYVSRPQPIRCSATQPSRPALLPLSGERKNSFEVPPRFQQKMEQTQTVVNHAPSSTVTVRTDSGVGLASHKSLLNEYCQKLSYPPPQYVTTLELRPDRENLFMCQVTVNGLVIKCSEGRCNKKDAERTAAKTALEHLGVIAQLNKAPETRKPSVEAAQKTQPSADVTQKAPQQSRPAPVSPPPKPLARTKGEEELARMIRQLFKNRPKGIWAARLPAEFKARFNEDFPNYAKDKLRFWPDVVRTDSSNGPIIYFPVQEQAGDAPSRDEHPEPSQNSHNGNHQHNEFLTKMMDKFQHTKTMSITIQGHGKEEKEEPEQLSSLKSVVNVVVRPAELPSVGTKLQVFMSHVESPDCFYVHPKDCVIDNIQRIMTELYKDTWVSEPSSYSPGTSCAAQYTADDAWCRAVLTQPPGGVTGQGEDCCFVQYVDFGNCEFVGKKRVQRLVVRAVQHPAQALPCQLHMVQSNPSWSQAAKDRFQELTREDVELTMTVTAAAGDRCSVHLLLPGGDDLADRLAREQLLPLSMPEAVPLPEEQFLQVLVVDCNNTTEVVVRISEESYRAELKEFVREMTEYYNRRPRPAPHTVLEGHIYAAFEATEGVWCRVQAVDVEDDMVKCYFLDFGDTDVLTVSSLRLLAPCFSTQPVQVIKVQLAGLQDFSTDPEVLSKLFDLVAGKNCFAEIEERGPVPVVTFYDTGTEEDINVNEVCLSVVDARDLAPTVPAIGERLEGNVQFVDSSGLIYFTSPGPGLDKLEELMASADQQSSVTEAEVASPELGKIYYSCFTQDECWYRAEVTALLPDDKVSVRYIDFGNSETMEKNSLRSLQSNPQLACLPPQALRCRLSDLPPEGGEWTPAGTSVLSSLCKEGEEMICTIQPVQEPTEDGVLTVELVLTSGDQVCQVNRYLQEQPHLFSPVRPGVQSDKLNNNSNKSRPGSANNDSLSKSRPGSANNNNSNKSQPGSAGNNDSNKSRPGSANNDSLSKSRPGSAGSYPVASISRSASPCSSVSSGSVFTSPCTSPVPACISPKTDFESLAVPFPRSSPNSAGPLDSPVGSCCVNGSGPEEDTNLADRISQLNVAEDQVLADASDASNLSSPRVPTLTLPGKGRMLNVFIEDAIGPDHFVLRPFDSMELVGQLESDMDEFYGSGVSAAADCVPTAGALYAAFVEEAGTWERVCVKDIAQNGDVSVWGLDKGGYHVVSPSNLRPLEARFCAMPAQAMTGQLGGVAPAKGDKWSPPAEDLFRRLVQGQAFVALLLSTPRCAGRRNHFRQVCLNLRLIDTSNPDRDVLIEDILVSKGHARVLANDR